MHYSKNVHIGDGAHDVPMENVPRLVNIGGEPHILAYISRDEAAMLRQHGGGVAKGGGQKTGPGGLPSYDDDNGGDRADRAGNTNDSVGNNDGGANYGGGDGGYGFDTRGSDVGGRAGSPSTGASGSSDSYGGDSSDPYDTRASDVGSRAGSPSTGIEAGFFGGDANYGGGGPAGFSGIGADTGISGGAGGSEGSSNYQANREAQAPAPPPAAPKGPTPEEIAAENARIRKKAEDDAEALVRKAFSDKFNDPYYAARKDAYLNSQDPEIAAARAKALNDLVGALAPSGLADTPLANRQAAGLGTLSDAERKRLGDLGGAEVTDYQGRVGKGLTGEIARVRAAADPMAAYTSGTPTAITGIDTDILNRPLADFIANLGYSPDAVVGANVQAPMSLVEALRQRGGPQLYEPASSSRVVDRA